MTAKANRLYIAPPPKPTPPEWETIWTCDNCGREATTEGLYSLPGGWITTHREEPRFRKSSCGVECLVLMVLELKDGTP